MNLIRQTIHINHSTIRDKIYCGKTLHTEDEKPSNYLSVIDRFVENGLKHIIRFPIRDVTLALEKRDPQKLCNELVKCSTL